MIKRINHRTALWILFILISVSALTAIAAANTVPTSRLAQRTIAINANDLKPAACAALNLTAVVACPSGGGACNGTAASELILGTANIDTIKGKGGSDCILGGAGDDDLSGNGGTDVCIGGPGTDTFHACATQIQ